MAVMDWFQGKFTGKPWENLWFNPGPWKAPYLMGKSMVSGSDFHLNQSIEWRSWKVLA
jgi:hypothetical protein